VSLEFGIPVVLHIYDVSPCLNAIVRAGTCRLSLWGLYHTGICVREDEVSFGGHPGTSTGVSVARPRAVRGAKWRGAIVLGHTQLDPLEVRQHLIDFATDWRALPLHFAPAPLDLLALRRS
jgi:hypothetical protein